MLRGALLLLAAGSLACAPLLTAHAQPQEQENDTELLDLGIETRPPAKQREALEDLMDVQDVELIDEITRPKTQRAPESPPPALPDMPSPPTVNAPRPLMPEMPETTDAPPTAPPKLPAPPPRPRRAASPPPAPPVAVDNRPAPAPTPSVAEAPPAEPEARATKQTVKNGIPTPESKPPVPPSSPLFTTQSEPPIPEEDTALSPRTRDIFAKIPPTERGALPGQYNIELDRASDTGLLPGRDQDALASDRHGNDFQMELHVSPVDKSVEELLEEAYEALVSGQSEVAITLYKDILQKDPENRLGLFGIATSYHRMGQRRKALKYYENLLYYYPDFQDGINNFIALASEESPEDALREIEILAKKNPGYSPIYAQMAMIYKKMGNPRQAVFHLTRAVRLSPENLSYRYNLAVLHDQLGDYREAIVFYEHLVDAWREGAHIPGNISAIQERLTFLRNK